MGKAKMTEQEQLIAKPMARHSQEMISTPQSKALTASWERQIKALNNTLRASGRTVTVVTGAIGWPSNSVSAPGQEAAIPFSNKSGRPELEGIKG
jgi:hypothetical protein